MGGSTPLRGCGCTVLFMYGRSLLTLVAALLMLASLGVLPAQAATAVWSGQERLDVRPAIEGYLSDQTKVSPDADWRPISELDIDGYRPDGEVLHLRFDLTNTTSQAQSLWLAIDASFLNQLQLSIGDQTWQTGEDRPFHTRPIPHTGFVFPVSLAPGETRSVQAQVRSTLMHLPVELWRPAAFMERSLGIGYRNMLYFGLMGTLVIYCILLYFATRVRSYLSFAAFAGLQAFFFALIFGYGFRYGWPEHPEWNRAIMSLTLYGLVFSLGHMTLMMLGTPERPARLHRVMKAMLIGLVVGGITLGVVGNRFSQVIFPVYWVMATLALIVVMLVLETRAGSRRAQWFALAWTPMLAGALVLTLSAIGWFPYDQTIISMLLASMAATSLALSFIIALYIRDSINRRQNLERETLQLKANLAEQLEREVERRTAELEETNRRLNHLALTDPLTGLPNRRQLDEFGELHHRLMHEIGGDLFVAILDLDHFKAINDRFGHEAGDAVLIRTAEALIRQCQYDDTDVNILAGRLGGEEFAIVGYRLSESDYLELLESIRRAVAELTFPPWSEVQLTVSTGWARVHSGTALSASFRRADQRLYRAKSAGRNRICGETEIA